MKSAHEFYDKRYSQTKNTESCRSHRHVFNRAVERTLGILGTGAKRILDFGCNTGAAAKRFSKAGHQVTGVDISSSAIEVSKIEVPRAKFIVLESENQLPFVDGSFDVCFASEVIEHVFDVRGCIREIYRILSPGGLFLITVPYHGWLKNLGVISFNFEKHFSPQGGHIRFFSKKSMKEALVNEGFLVDQMAGLGRFWPLWRTLFAKAHKP